MRHAPARSRLELPKRSMLLIIEVCRQKEAPKIQASAAHQNHYRHQHLNPDKSKVKTLEFDFEVDDFYCLGSPIGIYHYPFHTILFEVRNQCSMSRVELVQWRPATSIFSLCAVAAAVVFFGSLPCVEYYEC